MFWADDPYIRCPVHFTSYSATAAAAEAETSTTHAHTAFFLLEVTATWNAIKPRLQVQDYLQYLTCECDALYGTGIYFQRA